MKITFPVIENSARSASTMMHSNWISRSTRGIKLIRLFHFPSGQFTKVYQEAIWLFPYS